MEIEAISLLQYNERIKQVLAPLISRKCWVTAELSDVAVRGGHCYLELVQKDESNTRILAKCRGVIWANVFARVRYEFESATQMPFASGLKLMLEVSANYHEQYGFSLVISNINPEYTLGSMALKRREILRRLAQEGIIDMNKELAFPEVPQRIAVVSAEGAAGYGDFMNQLTCNPAGLQFYTKLFPAIMQGERTVPSVIAALDRVAANQRHFDCVVIIRGGGATSELHCFDNYDLAAHVARFPLPVIVGIGHERDVTVLDDIAAMRVKTPTAAAEWLIARGESALTHLGELSNLVVNIAGNHLAHAGEQLAHYTSSIPIILRNITGQARMQLSHYAQSIPMMASGRIMAAHTILDSTSVAIKQALNRRISTEKQHLQTLEEKIDILSPLNTLSRGYSITRKDGLAVTDATQLPKGTHITTIFADGEVQSIVE